MKNNNLKEEKGNFSNVGFTQNQQFNYFFAKALKTSRFYGKRIYPCVWKKYKRRYRLYDGSDYIISLLDSRGFKWTVGNDSPRGGKEGYFVQVYSKKALEYLVELRK